MGEITAKLRRLVMMTSYLATIVMSLLRENTLQLIFSDTRIIRLLASVLIFVLLALSILIHRSFPKTHERASDFQKLCTTGFYSHCRHPFYLTLILLQFSISLYFCSIEGMVVFLPTLLAWYALARYEEKDLLQHYGEDYREYMKRVRMYVPLRRRNPNK